jgi:predicted transcriptional regulator
VKEAPLTRAQIVTRTGMNLERVDKNIAQLVDEGFIKKKGRVYSI